MQRLDFADSWTVAGLMAREDVGTNGRYSAVLSTPSVAGTFFQARTNVGTASLASGAFPVNYPYTWLRLQRYNGTKFTGFASLDGQTWTQLGTYTYASMPPRVYLGFVASSHSPSQSVTAQFRDFQDNTNVVVGPPLGNAEPPGPSSRRTALAITEIMYHPAVRSDGRKLEFIEIYNSNPHFQDISGFRISGDIGYKFPAGTVLPGGGYLVIARNPSDIQAVYGVTNVTGPYTGKFSNKKGTCVCAIELMPCCSRWNMTAEIPGRLRLTVPATRSCWRGHPMAREMGGHGTRLIRSGSRLGWSMGWDQSRFETS